MAGTSSPVDEILAALPEVGLRLVNLGQHTGGAAWGAQVAPMIFEAREIWAGDGATPAEALVAALGAAGVQVSDESP